MVVETQLHQTAREVAEATGQPGADSMTFSHIAEPHEKQIASLPEPPSDRVARWEWIVVLGLTVVIWGIIVGVASIF